MAKLQYQPVPHDHEAFLKKASKRKGFGKAYKKLEEDIQQARAKALANIRRRRRRLPANAPNSAAVIRRIRGENN